MSKRLKKKIILLISVIVVCMIATGFIVSGLQEKLSLQNCDVEISQQSDRLKSLLDSAADDKSQNTETYDAIYQSKADAVAYMKEHDAGYAATDAKMTELQSLLDVDNIMIVKSDGTISAKATGTKADFANNRFNSLKAAITGGDYSMVEVDLADQNWQDRYYAAKIDSDTMVVIEQNPKELTELNDATGSESSVLKNISIGAHGYVMSISSKDYLINYNPDSNVIGKDALDAGINVGDLEDGNHFSTTFNGQNIYCGVKQIDDTYYIFSIPESDITSSRTITVSVILFAFLAVMVCVAFYGIFVLQNDERAGKAEKKFSLGKYCYNEEIGKKAIVLSIIGLIFVIAVSFYMQTLFALSSQSVTNNERADQINQTIKQTDTRTDQLKEQYSSRYLTKCRIAAYIVDSNSDLADREKLAELANVLQIAAIYIIDGNGDMTASSTPQKSYSLSTNPEDESYAFRALLGGTEELVQDMSHNDATGEAQQFIGVATHDDKGYANGLVQIAVRPKRLETLLNSVKIDNVLSGVKTGENGFAFAVNISDGTIAYYPDTNIQGKKATDVGLTQAQLADNYTNYITVDGTTYFATCKQVDNYYLFVAGDEGELMAERGPLTLSTGIVAAICLLFIFLVLSLELKRDPAVKTEEEKLAELEKVMNGGGEASADIEDGANRNIEVTLVDGRVKRSESAVSRWLNRSIGWHEKTPEQKLGKIIKLIIGIAAFVVAFSMIFQDSFFAKNSVIAYILSGNWERGVNVFAVTASVMFACMAITVASILQWMLHLLADVLGARGETVCRLVSSIVKYGTIIFMLYWCLGLLGVDTTTLLASMGIITLALSLGAKDLITDILSGFFIIMEGEFRVGDVIKVGSNSGTVMDIGVRTTKIKNGDGDVLVLRNSGISNVINRTRLDSYATVDFLLPTGESLSYLENVLSRELPKVRRRVPEITDGPYYKGVVELNETPAGAAYMKVRVVATCKEKDRANLERELKREMKILLTRNDIAPFTEEYDHDMKEEKTLEERVQDAREQRDADKFNTEQKAAAQTIGNENPEQL